VSDEEPMNRLTFSLSLAVLLTPLSVSAQGTAQGHGAMLRWKQMDNCAKQAQAAYPDNNPASNASRDTTLKACLEASSLPSRQPLSQSERR
jgi:hypothetical protein